MNSTGNLALGVGITLVAALSAGAVTPSTRAAEYNVIHDRNPFGLVPPPPLVTKAPEPEVKEEIEPPPNIELTGFFRNARKGKTVALILVEKSKGEPKESYMWSVDDGDDGMKVLAIDEARQIVRLSVRGKETSITFSEKKAAPAPVRTLPQRPGQAPRQLPAVPNVTAGDNSAARQFDSTRGGRFGRSRTTSSAVGGALPTTSADPRVDNLQSVAPRSLRIPGNTTQNGGQTRMEPMTPLEEELIIELSRGQQDGPPLPPTSLTPPEVLQDLVVPPAPNR